MTLEKLIHQLTVIAERNKKRPTDKEQDHLEVDRLLLEYIKNDDVTRLFDGLDIWYA